MFWEAWYGFSKDQFSVLDWEILRGLSWEGTWAKTCQKEIMSGDKLSPEISNRRHGNFNLRVKSSNLLLVNSSSCVVFRVQMTSLLVQRRKVSNLPHQMYLYHKIPVWKQEGVYTYSQHTNVPTYIHIWE